MMDWNWFGDRASFSASAGLARGFNEQSKIDFFPFSLEISLRHRRLEFVKRFSSKVHNENIRAAKERISINREGLSQW